MSFPHWRGFNVYRDCAATLAGITAGPIGLIGVAAKKLIGTNDNPLSKSNVLKMTAAAVAGVGIAFALGASAPWLVGVSIWKGLPFLGAMASNLISYSVASPGWEAKNTVQS